MVEYSLSYAEFLLRILTAALGGILIGIERERMQLGRPEIRARSMPGVRSFGLISIYGGLAAIIASITAGGSSLVWSIIFSAATLGLALFLLVYVYLTMSARRAPGMTTYMVILVAYMVGVLAGMGGLLEAASISVLATLLLALKNTAVTLAKAIRYEELVALMEVAALAIIIGPLIATYAHIIPWIDVYRIYMFFLLVLSLSLTSYGAARIWGPRGLVYGTLLGSIVNSEATIAGVTRLLGSLPSEGDVRVKATRVITFLVASAMQAKAAALAIASIIIFAGFQSIGEALPLVLLAVLSTFLVFVFSGIGFTLAVPPITVGSPLSWYTALKAAVAYTALISLAKLLELIQAPSIVYVPLVAVGGFVNATATMIGLASVISFIGVSYTSTLALIAIAFATLNKIVYSERGALGPGAFRIVVRISIVMALIPLILALLQLVFQV